jgi:photosystem II stability/assembly factor-like uncharacterized protein
MFTRVALASVLFLSLLVTSRSMRAQSTLAWPEWMEVGSLGDLAHPIHPSFYTAFYFFDPLHGVAAVRGQTGIYYIYNKAGLWRPANIPSGFGHVRAIRLIQGKLYAATDGPDILISSDSGKSWKFSGLGYSNANDVYADASGAIRVLTDPMKVFARLDTLHCVASGSTIFVSSDGGRNWNPAATGLNANSRGIFADRCSNVYICPSSQGVVLRSTDFGQTWKTVYTGLGGDEEYLGGASSTAYVTNNGLFRSIDDGLTWKTIITAYEITCWPMFAFGPMGEHVVVPWTFAPNPLKPWIIVTEPWMTFTGGDDMLHSAAAMTDSNGAPLMQQDTMNVPFQVMSFCNAFKIPVAVESDVDDLSVDVKIQNDSLGDFSLLTKAPANLRHGHEDTLWLAYQPHHPVSNVTLRFDNHWHCSDWSETRSVHVVAVPTADIAPPPVFGAACIADTQAAIVHLDSCMTLAIDSVAIPSSISGRLQLLKTLPDTVHPGGHDSLFFSYTPPDSVGTFFDSVVVYGHYIGLDSTFETYWYYPHAWGQDTSFAFFHKTLPIWMASLHQMVLLPQGSPIAFARQAFCDRNSDTVITLTNNGCAPDTLTSVGIKGLGYSLANPPSLPIILPVGDTVKIPLQFAAPDTGSFAGSLEVEGSSGAYKKIVVPLRATGYPPRAIFGLQTKELVAGRFTICGGDTIVTDTIFNRGCDTLLLRNIHISGDEFEALTPIVDTVIPPQSWRVYKLQFHPRLKGPYKDSITFESQSANGSDPLRRDTVVLLGEGLEGTKYVSTSIESLDLHTLYTCETNDTTIWIYNTGCDTMRLDSARFVNSIGTSNRFFLVDAKDSLVKPDDSVAVVLHFDPDTTGHPASGETSLHVYTNANNSIETSIPLSVSLSYPVHIALSLQEDASAKGGSLVTFQLVLHGDRTNLSALHFDLTHDDDLLTYDSITSLSVHQDSVTMSGSEAIHHFTLSPLPQSDTVATVAFTARLARINSTPVAISDVTLNNTKGAAPACIGSLDESGANFTYLFSCGDPLLQQYLNGSRLSFENIRPNPASDRIEIGIAGVQGDAPDVRISIYDLLGREVLHSVRKSEMVAGVSERAKVDCTIESLGEGIYYVRASVLEGSPEGHPLGTRRLVIER